MRGDDGEFDGALDDDDQDDDQDDDDLDDDHGGLDAADLDRLRARADAAIQYTGMMLAGEHSEARLARYLLDQGFSPPDIEIVRSRLYGGT